MASLMAKSTVAVRPAAKVSTGSARKFMIWNPTNNKMFETFSYLPPLSNDQIAAQVDYMVYNGWIPCLEFSEADKAYTANTNTVRMGPVTAGYYDNRYWTMWKLPMFGCSDPNQVLKEIQGCTRAFPDAYIRLVAFDNYRQVQIAGFLVHRPASATDYQAPEGRSVSGETAAPRAAASRGRPGARPASRPPSSYSW